MAQMVVQIVLAWGEAARMNYGVDPFIWLIIGTAAAPAFYYSIYRLVRAVSKRSTQDIMLWGTVFGFATLALYLYVMLFGRNLPWWIYAAMMVLIGQGGYAVVRKVQRKTATPVNGKPSESRNDNGIPRAAIAQFSRRSGEGIR